MHLTFFFIVHVHKTLVQSGSLVPQLPTHPCVFLSLLVTVCWTRWYDRDDPSGTGDWEPLSNLRSENPGQICDNPLYIEAVTTGNNPVLATSTGQTFHV